MHNPLLSIAIATKNRVPYCISVIESILSISDSDFELVVQDNSDIFDLKEYILRRDADKRLVYNYTPPPFSSIDNFNALIDLCKGEYVCMIGDDDGINPELINIVKIIKEKGIDSISNFKYPEYFWPNSTKRSGDNGQLILPSFNGSIFSFNPSTKINQLLFTGIVNYLPFNLPKVYHGIIRKTYLDKIKQITGNYFGGLSPDIYSSICLTFLVKKHYLIDYPLTISGVCKSSTSADNDNKTHSGQLKDAPHLRSRENYKWDSRIPKYYSVQTIWAESGVRAFNDIGKGNMLNKFNLKFLIAQSLLQNKKIRKLILEETRKTLQNSNTNYYYFRINVKILILLLKGRRIFNNIISFLSKKNISDKHFNNVRNIDEATGILKNNIQKINYLKLLNEGL